jgi:hypothetical protein
MEIFIIFLFLGVCKIKWLSFSYLNRASGFSTPVFTSEEVYLKVFSLQEKVSLQVFATPSLRNKN